MSPEHHLVKDFHLKHMELHQKFPERFHPDNENSAPSLPTYFGNVCLRFIPVFDIVVHRYVEFKIFQLGSFILTSEYLPPAAKLKLRYATDLNLNLNTNKNIGYNNPAGLQKQVGNFAQANLTCAPTN